MDYLKEVVKQDTLASLRNSPLHMSSLCADRLIAKAEEEINHRTDRFSSGTSHKKTDRYHPYSQPTKHAPDI